MGNWRTVNIEGTCDASEVEALGKALDHGVDYENFHCLCNGGICGLPMWADEKIYACGNLAERGYEPDDVAKQLEKLAKIAPSLAIKIHCGDDYESDTCVATVTLSNGSATVGGPEIKTVRGPSTAQMQANMMQQMLRR